MKHALCPKVSPIVLALSLAFGAVSASPSAHAATLTVTPNAVATDFSGTLALDIQGGLTTGETVVVERFADLNGNGLVDPGEPLTMSFRLTDGQATVIDGITNVNMPHDLNPADGAISAGARFRELDRFAGKQIFRVSSPMSGFTPVTAVLTINNPAHAQSVSGVARSGGAGVPYAFVGLMSTGEDDHLVAGAIADGAGNFTIAAPPAGYMLFATKSGYVISETPEVTLGAGVGVTQDVELIPATRVISGRVVDAGDSNIGLPGMEMFFDSDDAFTFTFTDSDGYFSAGVIAGFWAIETGERALSLLGYLEAEDEEVSTEAGDATGLELAFSEVTALVYGYLTGPDELPLAGIEINSNNNDNQNGSGGITDENGYYVTGVTAGIWWIGPSQDDMGALGFSSQGTNVTLSAGEAVRADLTAISFTAYLSGRVVDQGGNGVAEIGINANSWSGGWSNTQTDANGYFSVGVFAGTWNLQLSSDDAAERGLVGSNLTFEVSDGVDITGIVSVARSATAFISGSVQETDGSPVSSVGVSANTTIDGTNYNIHAETDASGNYSLGVFNGTWSVNVSGDDLSQRGFPSVEGQTAEILNGNATVNFTVAGFTAYLSGQVVDQDGIGVANIRINANNWPGTGWSNTYTDANGNFSLGVFAGNWNLKLGNEEAEERGLIGPNLTFGVSDGTDITGIVYVAHAVTGFISGSVQETDGSPVSSVGVFASTTVGETTYNLHVLTDEAGNYSLSVFNGTWSVGVSGSDLYQQGLSGAQNQTIEISDANATANFTVSPLEPLEITTTSLPAATVGEFYWVGIEVSGGVPPYNFTFAPGSNGLPSGLILGENGHLSGTPQSEGTTTFTVRVIDWFGNSADQTLSLTVNSTAAAPPRFVQINQTSNGDVEMYLSGQEGITYQIQATPSLSQPDWLPLQNSIAGTGGTVYFRDTTAGSFTSRFYRAVEVQVP